MSDFLEKNYEDVRFNVIRVTRGVDGCQISLKKVLRNVRFNVISITRQWEGVKFP